MDEGERPHWALQLILEWERKAKEARRKAKLSTPIGLSGRKHFHGQSVAGIYNAEALVYEECAKQLQAAWKGSGPGG